MKYNARIYENRPLFVDLTSDTPCPLPPSSCGRLRLPDSGGRRRPRDERGREHGHGRERARGVTSQIYEEWTIFVDSSIAFHSHNNNVNNDIMMLMIVSLSTRLQRGRERERERDVSLDCQQCGSGDNWQPETSCSRRELAGPLYYGIAIFFSGRIFGLS